MLFIPLMFRHNLWIVVVLLQSFSYFLLLGKMGIPRRHAILPFVAEKRLAKDLFPFQRSFYRPFVVATIISAAALYLNPFSGTSIVTARAMLLGAFLIYSGFLFRLYWRLARAFGRSFLFGVLTWLLPPLGLCMLARGKKGYTAPVFRELPQVGPVLRFLGRASLLLISGAEILVLILVVGFFTLKTRPPRIIGEVMLEETLDSVKDVTGTGVVITREETMGEAAASLVSMPTSREKYFPDHSQDQSVVVMGYIIGSDLEDKMGFASANIAQMIEATKKGSGLAFVLECGGSGRWFTDGIEENGYGRYIIRDGKLEKVLDLDYDTCMSESSELADFISWTKDNYAADRYMLVMWDHGGGLSVGYGMDIINKREGMGAIPVDEIISAIATSGVKFDLLGFDACLMQDIDLAMALEPYADYYLGSEEVEGAFGWYYTSAFGKLAENPGIGTEDFAKELIASYDPYNTIINDNEADTMATLSLVDLPRAKAAYGRLEGFFKEARRAIRADSTSFANISLSGTKSYSFSGDQQIDLIDFLTRLETLDYEDKICTPEQIEEYVNAVRACIVYRNGNSAEGINGISLCFPCESASDYTDVYQQFKALSANSQRRLYTDFFSIVAAQKKKEYERAEAEGEADPLMTVSHLFGDLTGEEWYEQGFENYETQEALIEISLTETPDGYRIEMPEKAWGLIADEQLIAYQRAEDGRLRYLGVDSIGGEDETGHPLVAMGDTWVGVNGRLVSYESGEVRETKRGHVFTGSTKALINGEEAKLFIEWDPVSGDSDEPVKGRITGYNLMSDQEVLDFFDGLLSEDVIAAINSKAKMDLKAGDRIEFLFDYYDDQGNLVGTSTYGRAITVTKAEGIYVDDVPLGECDILFGGVLVDVYQRRMTTEKIEAHIPG